AMLHSELILRGRVETKQNISRHVDIAESIVETLPHTADRFRERWYVFAASLFLARTLPDDASRIVGHGRHFFKQSASLIWLEGVTEELRAHFVNSNAHDPAVIRVAGPTRTRILMSIPEARYREALKLDPGLLVARLHLGRVLFIKNELNAARVELTTVADTSTDDRLSYLAQLFLVALAEMEEDRDRARSHYERAMAIAPEHQTSYVALSYLEEMTGHSQRAQELMAQRLRSAEREADDPWWAYQNGGVELPTYSWLR